MVIALLSNVRRRGQLGASPVRIQDRAGARASPPSTDDPSDDASDSDIAFCQAAAGDTYNPMGAMVASVPFLQHHSPIGSPSRHLFPHYNAPFNRPVRGASGGGFVAMGQNYPRATISEMGSGATHMVPYNPGAPSGNAAVGRDANGGPAPSRRSYQSSSSRRRNRARRQRDGGSRGAPPDRAPQQQLRHPPGAAPFRGPHQWQSHHQPQAGNRGGHARPSWGSRQRDGRV